jgi:hypothetical protein
MFLNNEWENILKEIGRWSKETTSIWSIEQRNEFYC